MAAGLSVDLDRWRQEFDELMLRVSARFARVEPRRRARAFVLGLLAGLPRVNCWSIAGHAGDATPGGMQHLLSRASWDAGGVRDDLRRYVTGCWAIQARWWWSMRPAMSRRGPARPAWPATTPAPQAGPRTPRSLS